jgi:putative ABC transport system permease protein
VQDLVADLRHALRSLRSHLAFTATAVVTLALGMGATTTIYGIVDGIVLRPLAFPNADRLVAVCEKYPGATSDWCSISPPNVEDIAKRSKAIEAIGIGRSWPYHLSTADGSEPVNGGIVTPDLFRALGVRPVLGRLFERSDLLGRESTVAILSYEMWQTRFGAAPDVVGRRIVLDGKPVTVVGVLPAGFQLPRFPAVALWRTVHVNPADEENREWRGFVAYGLRREGTSLASASAELAGIATQLRGEHFAKTGGWDLHMESLQDLVVGGVRPVLILFLAAVSFILLIACANVANLLLARAGSRSRELALRAAVGANRWRLVRGLLVESFGLAAAGALLGILLAELGTIAFKSLAPAGIPRMSDVRIDGRVLAFALTLSVATTLVFGLAPAWFAARTDPMNTLREGGRSSTPGSALSARLLVVAELALALVLLTGAGLLTRSFAARAAWNPGFERDHLLTFSAFAPVDRYKDRDAVAALLRRMESELSAIPGVERAGSASGGPLFGGDGTDDVVYTNRSGAARAPAAWYDMSPSYFATLGVPVVGGRGLSEADGPGTPTVVVVNETLARRFWPGDSPIDRQISLFSNRMQVRVVGVVRDVAPPTPGAAVLPELYWSNRQEPRPYTYFLLRTSVAPASVMRDVRARLRAIDPNLRPMDGATMPDLVAIALRAPRFQMLLLAAFSLTALLLAAVGTYGLFAYRVSRRTREIGIRLALGAQARQIVASVLRDGLRIAGAGIAIGVVAGLLAGRAMRGLVVGVSEFDLATMVASCGVLVAVTVAACLIPARSAARVDPVVTLTVE